MKNIILYILIGIAIIGCGSLVSIGDSNTNTLNNNLVKDE